MSIEQTLMSGVFLVITVNLLMIGIIHISTILRMANDKVMIIAINSIKYEYNDTIILLTINIVF